MAFEASETIASDLIGELNVLLASARYIQIESIVIKKLLRGATQLMNADPSQANLIKAAINLLCADVEKVVYHLKLANNLPSSNKPNLHLNSSVALSNLILYSKSQEFFLKVNDLTKVELFEFIDGGLGSLSIIRMNELFVKAEKMKLQIDHPKIELTSKAANVLRNNNISDVDVAKYADVFGELLREKRIMIKGEHPDIVVGDSSNNWHPETVFIAFKIEIDVIDATKLYKEGMKRLLSEYKDFPEYLHLSIEAH